MHTANSFAHTHLYHISAYGLHGTESKAESGSAAGAAHR